MPLQIDTPSFTLRDFNPHLKKCGISGIMRLRNEADYLAVSIDSIIHYVDELIIVYNRCTDNTPQIVSEYEKRFPSKIRAFHYVPHVYPQGSKAHAQLPPDSVNSLVHYYNYALSKASFKVVAKWDGDMVAIPKKCEEITRRIRRSRTWERFRPGFAFKPSKASSIVNRFLSKLDLLNQYWWFSGINLWDEDDQIYVNLCRPICGMFDHGFWQVNPDNLFEHDMRYEQLSMRGLAARFQGICFYHLKGMKKDRGISVYELEDNPESVYHDVVKRMYTDVRLCTLDEFRESYLQYLIPYIQREHKGILPSLHKLVERYEEEIPKLPNPQEIGIKCIRQ